MTTRSPRHVWYELELGVFDPSTGLTHEVHVDELTPSADMDRVPYCAATVVLARPSAAVWAVLDPRKSLPATVKFRVHQKAYDAAGNPYTVLSLPRSLDGSLGSQTAELVVRRAVRNWITGQVTLDVQGRESMMDDKRRIATNTINTGATNVSELVQWSLNDVFGGHVITAGPAMVTAIPAGDRRLMLPGESHSDLIEPELDAIGYRLYDNWGIVWFAIDRATAPAYSGAPTLVKLGTYDTDEDDTLPADVDPIVTEAVQTLDRGGDWADGVLVKGSWWNGTARTEWAQASGAGVNTKGRIINVERAQPASNLANAYKARTQIRGHSIDVTAEARFDVLPGMNLEVHLRGGTVLTGSIRAVEWDIPAGQMRLRVQTGTPL